MFVKLALDGDGKVKVTDDGKPIYLNDKDEEVPVDPPAMYQKIIDLGTEAKNSREEVDAVKTKFKVLDSIDDIDDYFEKATKALEQVENFDDKDWMDVKKVESMKAQMKEAHAKELTAVKAQFEGTVNSQQVNLDIANTHIRTLMVGNKFATSPLFSGTSPKTNMSADVAESFFGHHFKGEVDEKNGDKPIVRAYFTNGDPVISASPERVGELATFDEAISIIFDQYPNREQYIKTAGGGSGAGGGAGGQEETTDIGKLQAQYAEAQKARNTPVMIAIKNKITALKNQQRGGRA